MQSDSLSSYVEDTHRGAAATAICKKVFELLVWLQVLFGLVEAKDHWDHLHCRLCNVNFYLDSVTVGSAGAQFIKDVLEEWDYMLHVVHLLDVATPAGQYSGMSGLAPNVDEVCHQPGMC